MSVGESQDQHEVCLGCPVVIRFEPAWQTGKLEVEVYQVNGRYYILGCNVVVPQES